MTVKQDLTQQVSDLLNEVSEGEFQGIVTAYIVMAGVVNPDGSQKIVYLPAPHTPYWVDVGMLTAALAEYQNAGLVTQLDANADPEDDEPQD